MIPPLHASNDTPVRYEIRSMNPTAPKRGVFTHGSHGLGPVTPAMVRQRAGELAAMDGRPAHEISRPDWDKAMVELTGMLRPDTYAIAVEASPKSGDRELRVEQGVAGAGFDPRLRTVVAQDGEHDSPGQRA